MKVPTLLFVSGSIGLGHVTRDLAVAKALRRRIPRLQIDWLAGEEARGALSAAGEPVLSLGEDYATGTSLLEELGDGFSLNLANPAPMVLSWRGPARLRGLFRHVERNVRIFRLVTKSIPYDVILGDETFELAFALHRARDLKVSPFLLITDFVGVDAMTRSPLERLAVRLLNRAWVGLLTGVPPVCDGILFAGDPEDVPDQPFGWGLPNRRECAVDHVTFVGPVCPFDREEIGDREALRARLGYGAAPLIVCSVGGTALGQPLLDLCARTYPLLRESLEDLQMVLVCGPRIPPEAIPVPHSIKVLGHVDRLYEHLAACDLAIVQGGGSTTLELEALGRPFLYFPLAGHFEQRLVSERLKRRGAGREMSYPETDPASLAKASLAALRQTKPAPAIVAEGAMRIAQVVADRLHA